MMHILNKCQLPAATLEIRHFPQTLKTFNSSFKKSLQKLEMGPKQKSQIQAPKSFWSRRTQVLISVQVLSHIISNSQSTQGEAIGADPGMDLPVEALIWTGPKQTWGSELVPKLFQLGPSPTEWSAGDTRQWCCQSSRSPAVPDPSPGQALCPLAAHKARAKPGEHTDPPTQPHTCPPLPGRARGSSRSCPGVLGVVLPGNVSRPLCRKAQALARGTGWHHSHSLFHLACDSQRHEVTNV